MKLQTTNPVLLAFLKLTALIAVVLIVLWIAAVVAGLVFKVIVVAAIIAALVLAGLFIYSAIRRRPIWEALSPLSRLFGRS